MFQMPPVSTRPATELEHIEQLEEHYNMRMAALVHYLHEDDLKNSDTGEAAMLEQEREEVEHKRLLEENELENERVAGIRAARLQKLYEERKQRIRYELDEFERSEKERLVAVDKLVEKHKIEMEGRIREEDLEQAIMSALTNPVDHEYAIDRSGLIFRGRITKSNQTNPKDHEQIPLAVSKDQLENKSYYGYST